MGVRQDETAYAEIKNILNIPQDEPIFILRAQDNAAQETLGDYMFNAQNTRASYKFLKEIGDISMEFADWRTANQDKCKTPD